MALASVLLTGLVTWFLLSSRSNSVAAQEAAAAFLANQFEHGRVICLRMSSRPGPQRDEMVRENLEDPPAALVARLSTRGLNVQPFSTCKPTEHHAVVLSIGWPSAVPDGFEVPADRLCGALGCDGGYLVHVKRTSDGWHGVGAKSTWIS